MPRQKALKKSLKKTTWNDVSKVLAVRNWTVVENRSWKKVWQRGNEIIVSFKVGNKWKTEYLERRGRLNLRDAAGASDEEFAKYLAMELGIGK